MEPRFFHNDIITPNINNVQIGVFYYENEAYLKKYHFENNEIYLVSLNEKYKPIHIQNDTFKVIGIII